MERNVSADSSKKEEEQQEETTEMNETHRGRTETRVSQCLLSYNLLVRNSRTEKKLTSRVEPQFIYQLEY